MAYVKSAYVIRDGLPCVFHHTYHCVNNYDSESTSIRQARVRVRAPNLGLGYLLGRRCKNRDRMSASWFKSTASTKAIPTTMSATGFWTHLPSHTRQIMAHRGALLEAIKGGAQGFIQGGEHHRFSPATTILAVVSITRDLGIYPYSDRLVSPTTNT
jgi:hypothetical protein